MIDPNNEKPGKSEEASSFGLIILIVFIIAMLYAVGLVLINKYSTQDKPAAVMIPSRVDLKLAEQVLDTIEDYYLVNKADRRTVKVLCLEKTKIDTITIKQYVSHKNR